MKKLLLVFSLLVFSLQMNAQTEKANVFTDFTAAKAFASEHQTNILMVFGGSDWCKPCIRFKNDILDAEAFQKWGADNIAVLYLDFPAKKKNKLSPEQTTHNETLAEQFNKSGFFPNIFILNSDEKVLANPKFKNQDADTFINQLRSIK